jgi:hypothetical protein
LNVEDCTITANTADSGGGVYDAFFGQYDDCTIVGNTSTVGGGGFFSGDGSAVYGCIIANNLAPGNTGNVSSAVKQGFTLTGSYNLIGTGNSGGLLAAHHNLLDVTNPVLGILGNYGGQTETIPLLPGSPAIHAGEAISGITVDQRGVTRPASDLDIGAFQDQGFSFSILSGGTQSAQVGHAFGTSLIVIVKSLAAHPDPVAGGLVTFKVPGSGASANLSTYTAIIGANGRAIVTATANDVAGGYVISADITGVAGALDFEFTNTLALASTPQVATKNLR